MVLKTVMVVLALMLVGEVQAQCPDGTPPPCAGTPIRTASPWSVAVLPFHNLTRDTADAFLADGLTEELIIRLSQVRRLDVKSRFESERARPRAAGDPRALGRELRAAYLVTGSLQQAGQRIRLRVALVRAATGVQVWGDVYDRVGTDILTIQSDISRAVASAITSQLLPDERAALARRPTNDPIAFNLYLRGVGAINTIAEPAIREGLDYLDRAIAVDSDFAQAYAYQALAWVLLADGYVVAREGYARSRQAAAQALDRDSTIALAWAALAWAVLAVDHDTPRALRLARRAVDLDPHLPLAHLALANTLSLAGASPDSISASARHAWEADTLSTVNAITYLWILHRLRRADTLSAMLSRMQTVLTAEEFRTFDGLVRLLRGDAAGAAERLSWTHYGGDVAGEYVRSLLAVGRRDAAFAVLDSIRQYAARAYYNPYNIAKAYAALGEADSAFALLDRAYEQRTTYLLWLDADVGFERLRTDPRWATLRRRIGLAR